MPKTSAPRKKSSRKTAGSGNLKYQPVALPCPEEMPPGFFEGLDADSESDFSKAAHWLPGIRRKCLEALLGYHVRVPDGSGTKLVPAVQRPGWPNVEFPKGTNKTARDRALAAYLVYVEMVSMEYQAQNGRWDSALEHAIRLGGFLALMDHQPAASERLVGSRIEEPRIGSRC